MEKKYNCISRAGGSSETIFVQVPKECFSFHAFEGTEDGVRKPQFTLTNNHGVGYFLQKKQDL